MPLIAALLTTPTALGQAFQSHGLNFVTVGDPGNRGATAAEAPLWPTWAPPLGAVDHTFGIMRTNITNSDWIEFVRAYAPHWTGGGLSDTRLTGRGIVYTGSPGGVPQYSVIAGHERRSADVPWRTAARFANWLHNDKSSLATAFENGAYDTSTFGEVVVGGITMLTDQITHNPDARFWIPTINEYTKGAHWDPNKNGPGQGGYWLMPNGGDDNLMAGPPGVGECAGDWWQLQLGFIDVELYPDTQSPWGMLDVSSTYYQFTEGYIHPAVGTRRLMQGSIAGSGSYWISDRMDDTTSVAGDLRAAIRIATSIPSPATVVLLGAAAVTSAQRRRRTWIRTPIGLGPP